MDGGLRFIGIWMPSGIASYGRQTTIIFNQGIYFLLILAIGHGRIALLMIKMRFGNVPVMYDLAYNGLCESRLALFVFFKVF